MATCNAGHGCSITCSNGCAAIYNKDTGQCTKWCESSAKEVDGSAFEGNFNVEINDMSIGSLAGVIGEARLGVNFKTFHGAGGRVSLKLDNTDLAGVIAEIGKQAL